ncbi:AIG2-like protein [Corchorus olitorius]|uniref:AIG2-like protein n=1 Tax=Corchorus olitorius TaxID=93759 RepID=A0A1R3J8E3_9ROSI|nr:AIG2-like protein [Corchorus olitorius]
MASATAATAHNVFVYGSLLADEVVLFGITDPELHILDEFEDVEYQRTAVEVSLLESCNKLQTHAYVWSDANDPNLYGDWDFEGEWTETPVA